MGMREVIDVIRQNDGFIIAGHRDPDGDSLGSSLALGLALESLGKRVAVLSIDPLFAAYRRLPDVDKVQITGTAPDGYPVAVFMECNGVERSGISGIEGRLVVNIDHHANNPGFGEVDWVDPSVAATGVMVYRLLQAIDVDISAAIATHLYVTILTDTGSFRYSNTNAEAFSVAAELVALGADPAAIAEAMYEHVPADKLRLLGAGLATLQLEVGGRIATMVLDHATLAASPDKSDTEGIVNHGKAIEGVVVAALFKEIEPDDYRVSLRSDGSVDVARIAASFGGGGHPRAAGCGFSGDLENVRAALLGEIRAAIEVGGEAA